MKNLILLILLSISCPYVLANHIDKARLTGKITSQNQPVPFVNILIKNTTVGTVSNTDGSFEMNELPTGKYTVKVQGIGYKSREREVDLQAGKSIELHFDLEEDVFGIEQVVVTADRNEQKRTDASIIVNSLNSKQLKKAQAVVVSDVLSYIPGLRTETNCQNCGMVQVRMNGLEGHYSQILINSRPIFSGLVGVYGLELFPTAMIERVEITRGGGSALYGSNAIAGTINILTKDPLQNSYDAQLQYGAIGIGLDGTSIANESAVNFKTSLISESKKTGMALFGSLRERDPFDANGDSFSELMQLKNISMGARLFHRLGYRSKITFDCFRINEDRRGGNKFDSPFHEANLTEAVQHKITTGALTYEYFMGTNSQLSAFASAQNVDRGSYYGADQSLSDYGQSNGFTYTIGSQFQSDFGGNSFLAGIEVIGDRLKDQKLGFPDYELPIYEEGSQTLKGFVHTDNILVAKQNKITQGAFIQYDHQINKLKLSAGLRFDHYQIIDNGNGTANCQGNVLSPRINALWHVMPNLQARATYSQGYRAPQIFDEDLHISASGSRKVIHKNAADLEQETSHSLMGSLDFNGKIGPMPIRFLTEFFHTSLQNAFVTNPDSVNHENEVIYIRTNAEEGAYVQGVNLETNISFRRNLRFNAGFTFQTSQFKEAQELGCKDFLRTPDHYGFFSLDWDITPKFALVSTAQYTGPMNIAYYDQQMVQTDENDKGELRQTQDFFDFGIKASYSLRIQQLPIEFYMGAKNLFNSFQSDFETGVERDPTYIYGPSLPRMIYGGIRITDIF